MRIKFDEVAQKVKTIKENHIKLVAAYPDSAATLFGVRIGKDSSFVSLASYEIIDFHAGKHIEYYNGVHNESILLNFVMNTQVNRYPNYIESFCFIHQLEEAIVKVINENKIPIPSKKQRLAALSYIINEMKES